MKMALLRAVNETDKSAGQSMGGYNSEVIFGHMLVVFVLIVPLIALGGALYPVCQAIHTKATKLAMQKNPMKDNTTTSV